MDDAVERAAEAGGWPLRIVRRGLRRREVLELLDEDAGVGILDPGARERLATTIRILGRTFWAFDIGAAGVAPTEELSGRTLGERVVEHGLEPGARFHVRPDPPPERRPEPDVSGPAAVDAAWERVERWLDANHPRGAGLLLPGASYAAIAALEERIGRELPEPLRASLRRHDGQGPDDYDAIVEGHQLLGAEQIAGEWEMLASIRADGIGDDDWWRPAWVPFTNDGSGQSYCVDLDDGSVVAYVHDDTSERVAERFEGWLARWAEELEAGEQVVDSEGDVWPAYMVDDD